MNISRISLVLWDILPLNHLLSWPVNSSMFCLCRDNEEPMMGYDSETDI